MRGAQASVGMTDEVLADALGMDRSTLSRKKNGERQWTAADMDRLRTVLEDTGQQLVRDLTATIANRQYLTPEARLEMDRWHVA